MLKEEVEQLKMCLQQYQEDSCKEKNTLKQALSEQNDNYYMAIQDKEKMEASINALKIEGSEAKEAVIQLSSELKLTSDDAKIREAELSALIQAREAQAASTINYLNQKVEELGQGQMEHDIPDLKDKRSSHPYYESLRQEYFALVEGQIEL
jgi:hypothetical protein